MALTLDEEVLDSTMDFGKPLEQIYRSIALEFSSENYNPTVGKEFESENYRPSDPNSYYWRERQPPIALADIADSILKLARSGHFLVETETGMPVSEISPGELWHYWFRVSDSGRALVNKAAEREGL